MAAPFPQLVNEHEGHRIGLVVRCLKVGRNAFGQTPLMVIAMGRRAASSECRASFPV